MSKMIAPPSPDNKGWRYVEKSTGHVMKSFQFENILSQVQAHRRSMGIPMREGWEEEVEDEMTAYNDSESFDPQNPQPFSTELEKAGRVLWKELHTYKQEGKWNPSEASRWLNSWEMRVPNFSMCQCLDNYIKLKSSNQPRFDNEEKFHEWTVEIHNAVNSHLGKPLYIDVVASVL